MPDIHHHVTLSFSGKRHLPGSTALPIALKDLFRKLNAKFSHTHFHLLTGLADGADQVAASAFDEHREQSSKPDNRWTMGAVMAFGKKDYLRTIENKDEFNRLYDGIGQKLHLDGKYVEGDAGKEQRAKAHRQQGQVLARFGDVLIAAAPREEKGKAGGTIENIVMALEKGKLVVFYDLDSDQYFLYNKITDWLAGLGKAENAEQIAEKLLLLLQDHALKENETDLEKIEPEKGISDIILQNPITQKKLFSLRAKAWNWFESSFKKKGEVFKKMPISVEFRELLKEIEEKRVTLSEDANKHQTHYRGSYILNYVASAMAIFIAVTAAVYYMFMLKYLPGVYWPLISLGILKLGIILLIIVNTKEANHNNHNKQAINLRYASERLKLNTYLLLGGIFSSPKPTLGQHARSYLHYNDGEKQYGQIISDLKSSVSYTLELTPEKILSYMEYAKRNWYGGQISYHSHEAQKYETMHHKLEHLSERLSALVFWIVLTEIIIKSIESHYHLPYCLKKVFGFLGPILLGLAALLPAVVIILISTNFQTESRKLSARYSSMVGQIDTLLTDLEQTRDTIQSKKDEGSVFAEVLGHLDTMGTLMIDEVADWSIFYENQVYEV